MSKEDQGIKLSPVQARERRQAPRPSAPLVVVGEVGSVGEGRAIFLHVRAIAAIMDSLPGQERMEVGGLLVGAECQDQVGAYLLIAGAVGAGSARSTPMAVTFTHEAWDQLLAEKAARYPGEAVVGWYHTHPGLGVFLSPQDLFIHRNFFAEAVHVALVVDPADFTWGIFYWQGPDLVAAQGCYIYGEPQEGYDHLAGLLRNYQAGGTQDN